jgi:hypothetical protein
MVPDDPPAPSRTGGGSNDPGDAGAGEDGAPSTGRFQVAHRDGTRVEVGEAVRVGGARPWMCAVKLMRRKRDEAFDGDTSQTLLVRVGRGATADDARRDAMAQLTLVYGSPVEPAPNPVILRKASDPPPRLEPVDREPPRAGAGRRWIARLLGWLRR